jgi:hypothetical protein
MPTRFSFVTIECPETGRPIIVAKNRDADPVDNIQAIHEHQRAAAEAYQADVEALSGDLRAPSRGPGDVGGWRGRRPRPDRARRHHKRLDRAHAVLGPDRSRLVRSVLVEGMPLPKSGVRELQRALDDLSVVYGLSNAIRHHRSHGYRKHE